MYRLKTTNLALVSKGAEYQVCLFESCNRYRSKLWVQSRDVVLSTSDSRAVGGLHLEHYGVEHHGGGQCLQTGWSCKQAITPTAHTPYTIAASLFRFQKLSRHREPTSLRSTNLPSLQYVLRLLVKAWRSSECSWAPLACTKTTRWWHTQKLPPHCAVKHSMELNSNTFAKQFCLILSTEAVLNEISSMANRVCRERFAIQPE
eukprot:2078294-Amphidinium_carterae.1